MDTGAAYQRSTTVLHLCPHTLPSASAVGCWQGGVQPGEGLGQIWYGPCSHDADGDLTQTPLYVHYRSAVQQQPWNQIPSQTPAVIERLVCGRHS